MYYSVAWLRLLSEHLQLLFDEYSDFLPDLQWTLDFQSDILMESDPLPQTRNRYFQ